MKYYDKFTSYIDKLRYENLSQDIEGLDEIIEGNDTVENILKKIDEMIEEKEIIYYTNAIDFIREDMMRRFGIACDISHEYELKLENIETIASLVLQEELKELANEIDWDDLLYNIENNIECKEKEA